MKDPLHTRVLSWRDVDRLIDLLLPKFDYEFNAMVLITRGGIIPGGLLAEAMNITHILTAAVDFPAGMYQADRLKAWPQFLQFPDMSLLRGRQTLIVDDVWGSGRTITAVKKRVEAMRVALAQTCVLHFNPHRTLFGELRPDYYAAVADDYIVYPWEIDRRGRGDRVRLPKF